MSETIRTHRSSSEQRRADRSSRSNRRRLGALGLAVAAVSAGGCASSASSAPVRTLNTLTNCNNKPPFHYDIVTGDVSPDVVEILFPGFYGTPLYADIRNGKVRTKEGGDGHWDKYQGHKAGDTIATWDHGTEELIAGGWTGNEYEYTSGDGGQVTDITYLCVKALTYGNPGDVQDGTYPWSDLNLNTMPATSTTAH